jgi:hypothetical protein
MTVPGGINLGNTTLTTLIAGTYTPTVTGSVSNPTFSGNTFNGWYLRINDWCLFHADVAFGTITGAGSGDVRISLPITATNYNLLQVFWNNVNMPGGTDLSGLSIQGQAYCLISAAFDDGTAANLTHTGLASTESINLTGMYQV